MARVTYNPAPGDPQTVQWGGKTFEAGKATDIDSPAIVAKAKGNPFFEVSASKDEQKQAELVGGYVDANTGQPVELVRTPRAFAYGNPPAGPTGPVPPSSASQGSTAIMAAANTVPAGNTFEEVYGAPQDEFQRGDAEVSAEWKGPEGTEGQKAKRGRPPKAKE